MTDPTPLAPPDGFEPYVVYGKKENLHGSGDALKVSNTGADRYFTFDYFDVPPRPALRGTVRELAGKAQEVWNFTKRGCEHEKQDWQAVVRLLAGAQVTDADAMIHGLSEETIAKIALLAELYAIPKDKLVSHIGDLQRANKAYGEEREVLERDLAAARKERDAARAELEKATILCDENGMRACSNPDCGFIAATGTRLTGHANGCPECGHAGKVKCSGCEACDLRKARAELAALRQPSEMTDADILAAYNRSGFHNFVMVNAGYMATLRDVANAAAAKARAQMAKSAESMPNTATASAGGCSTGGDSRPVRIVSTCAAPTVADCELAEQAALDAYTRAGGTVTDRAYAVRDGLRNRYMAAVLATDEARVRAAGGAK